MAIIHIVMFQFKSSAEPGPVNDACQRMLDLRTKCINPSSQKSYIQVSSGGKDCSPEGKQNGFTHAFVVEFEKEEDRKYYLEQDPAHLEFIKSLKEIVQNVCIVDYEPGVF